MIIIITGAIGIGKTTVCRKLIEIAQSQEYCCGGIITYKAPDQGIIIEDIQTGQTETLASLKDIYQGPRTKKYFFNPEGIDFGIQAIARGASSDILLVDEIGHLELNGEGFVRALEIIRAGRVRIGIVVIRKELLSAFLSQLDMKPLVFEVTIDNCSQLPGEISSILNKAAAVKECDYINENAGP